MAQPTHASHLFLRVEEAAQLLRISRSSAYEAAKRWLRTDGQEGLPCVRLGRRIVVPRAAVDRLAALGAEPTENPPASFS